MDRVLRAVCWLVGVVASVALLASPVCAQSSDVEKLLELLVKKNVVTQEEADALRGEMEQGRVVQRAEALAAQQAPAPAVRERPVTSTRQVRFSGWAQTRFTTASGANNSIELRRARIAVNGNLSDSISYRMQADFVRSPVLLDAHMDFTRLPYARMRVGQFKVPFSQENLTSSRDLLTIERALPVLALVPGRDTGNNGRDIGFEIDGSLVRGNGRPVLDYSVGLFNGAGINRRDDNHRKDAAVRVVTHLMPGLWVGGAHYNGASGVSQTTRERSAAEFAYRRDSFTAQGEYIWARDGVNHRRGSYTMLAYRFQPRWEGVFRFEELDLNTGIANNETRSYLVGINWYLNDSVKFQFNYAPTDDATRSRLNHLVLTQFQFQF